MLSARRRAFVSLLWALSASAAVACGPDNYEIEGEFGRPIPLVTGDALALPRFAFTDNGCFGPPGGCEEHECGQLLIDTLAPLSTLRSERDDLSLARECFEVRAGAGMAAQAPTPEARAQATARFRFDDVPVLRAPATPEGWTWTAGDQTTTLEAVGVIGGNLLRRLAVELRSSATGPESIAIYRAFPGSDRQLADRGFAFLPLQFPGRLLGRHLADRCDLDGEGCELSALDVADGQPRLALEPTRMVFDACLAPPPCTVVYRSDDDNPSTPGVCEAAPAFGVEQACADASDPLRGGRAASLVLASAVPGLVLFSDSAEQMFGTPEALPSCEVPTRIGVSGACRVARDGALNVAGWPPAGTEAEPLWHLRVRALAVLPGLARTRGIGACARLQQRRDALLQQCDRFVDNLTAQGAIEDVSPPYSAAPDDRDGDDHAGDPAAAAAAVLGETQLRPTEEVPDPDRWIDTLVVPATHPLAQAVRRDVAPDAIQPDGLLGSALFDETLVVLDYTDPNPGLRLRCLEPDGGRCMSAPECRVDAQAACCFGLPLDLRVSFILDGGDNTCCRSLSAQALEEIQGRGACRDVPSP